MPQLRRLATLLLVLTATACSTDLATGPSPTPTPGIQAASDGLHCYEGCLDPDPDPEAPGIYIPGVAYTMDGCYSNNLDSDHDGVTDSCEIQLASQFAPQMSFYLYDQVGRETRWFAHPLNDGYGTVRLGYLIGYYYDVGNMSSSRSTCELALMTGLPQFISWLFGGGDPSSCLGHLGDSEWIVVDVTYDEWTHHWVATQIGLSNHLTPNWLTIGSGGYATGISYGANNGSYPLVWVADGKHANYVSDAACDAGGTMSADNCYAQRTTARLNVMASGGNIGNWDYRLVDGVTCINADHPAILYYSGCGTEYYYTDQPFRGWYGSTGTAAMSYHDILQTILPAGH